MSIQPKSQAGGRHISVIESSLPKGGGSMRGVGESFTSDEFTGAATLTLPLAASPCRGAEPQLALTYSSGYGNGVFGLGFELAVPSVARRTEKGIPEYLQSDQFVLTGEDTLVPVGGVSEQSLNGAPYRVATYRPRTEDSFSRIEQWIAQADGSSFWRVVGRDNAVSTFGANSASRITDPADPGGTRVFKWLLEETLDARGNRVSYAYKSENLDNVPLTLSEENREQTANRYLERIRYGPYVPRGGAAGGADVAPEGWHFEIVFDYGEYDISATNPSPYRPAQKWSCRQDPFSTFHAGFEIRTHRLCRNILMFHRFEEELGEEPALVHATRLRYREGPALTFLAAVDTVGYRGQEGTRSVPPLEFRYTQFQPSGHEFQPLRREDGGALPGPNWHEGYALVDLFGEGLPGLLYSDGTATLYCEPGLTAAPQGEDGCRYAAPQPPVALPVEKNLNGEENLLMDVDGSGRMALVVPREAGAGYYAVTPQRTWASFRPFDSFPTDYHASANQLVDVTGDGLPDVLVLDAERVRVYPSLGQRGYGPPLTGGRPGDLPLPKENAPEVALRFADVLGSGRQHLVRVTNGLVECWPSLGRGRFGARLALDNAPRFEGEMDAARLFFADLDGSGTADLVYAYFDRVEIFFNQSGNRFSDPLTVPLPCPLDRLEQLRFADVFGNGTTCLVLGEPHPQPRLWCYDFSRGVKPHLLQEVVTNVGSRTVVSYCGSTKFYLADKQRGRPWATTLPFPAQVVEKVEHFDLVSDTRLVSSYAYHHGYYDGVEREFRGFGMVERLDAEVAGEPAPGHDETGAPATPDTPPLLTKTWYHTGRCPPCDLDYGPEFWGRDAQARPPAGNTFDYAGWPADDDTIRQSHRALKGKVSRQEVYGLDGTRLQGEPYSVTESVYSVRLLEPPSVGRPRVFFVHPLEVLAYNYERETADPRIRHELIAEVDEFGNVLRSCSVAYGRRVTGADAHPEQLRLIATAQENVYINRAEDGVRLLGVPQEQKTCELTSLALPSGRQYLTAADLADHLRSLSEGEGYRLLNWRRHYYWNPEGQGLCPLGQVTPEALPARVERAEFAADELTQVFEGVLTADALREVLAGRGGYSQYHGCWWNPGSTASFYGADRFFLPRAAADPFGNTERFDYDSHNLLKVKATDALGSETAVLEVDYLALQPVRVRDINQNVSEVLLDPLGMVIAASHYGTEDARPVGFMRLKDYLPQPPPALSQVVGTPRQYLQNAAAYFYYDFLSWTGQVKAGDFDNSGLDTRALWEGLVAGGYITPEGAILQTFRELPDASALNLSPEFLDRRAEIFGVLQQAPCRVPIHGVSLVAENYPSAASSTPVHTRVTYHDGFGREQHSLTNSEPGMAFAVDPDGSVSQTSSDGRWRASGRAVYNNKGLPVRQYEPYFVNTHLYLDNGVLNEFGVTPTFFYDPLQRLIRVETAKGFFARVEFAAWAETHYDENDTVKSSNYYRQHVVSTAPEFAPERQALLQAALFADTPGRKILDGLGRTIRDVEQNEGLVEGSAFLALGLSGGDSQALLAELRDGGFLDFRGALTTAYRPDDPGFSLRLSPGFASLETQVIAGLSSIQAAGTLLVTEYEWDARGNLLSSSDPRLSASGKKNLSLTYAVGGQALKAESVDAGTRWQINDATGNPVFVRDSRGFETTTSYDALRRPTAVHVRGGDGPAPLNQTVERFVYGDSLDESGQPAVSQPEDSNLRGNLHLRYDRAGVVYHDGYNTQGLPLKARRRFRQDYKTEAAWDDLTPAALDSSLQPDAYETQYEYDTLGRVTSRTDPDGSVYEPAYHVSGLLDRVQVSAPGSAQPDVYVQSIDYNAKGQRLRVEYGNGVGTAYSYEPTTNRLTELLTTRAGDSRKLQELAYTYDPVGNVTREADASLPTVFSSQQQIDPVHVYTYDALYRLVQGTGRQHSGLSSQDERRGGFDEGWFIPLSGSNTNDGRSLRNYTRRFSYDDAGNLRRIEHLAQGDSAACWSRDLVVSDGSNRALEGELLNLTGPAAPAPADQLDPFFDGNGNQKFLAGLDSLQWGYGDRLASVVTVRRDGAPSDGEYYVYDGAGARVRKVSERYGDGGATLRLEETIYLGSLEIRRVTQGGRVVEERHSLRVKDDERCVAVRHSWTQGEPPDGVTSPQVRFQFDDGLGSSVMEADAGGQLISYEEYFPYGGTALVAGRSFAETSLRQYRYSGKERDAATGLYYYGARYYAPWVGRWMSPDPAGAVDGLNLYAFVAGNPTSYADKWGYTKRKASGSGSSGASNKTGGSGGSKGKKQKATGATSNPYTWSGNLKPKTTYQVHDSHLKDVLDNFGVPDQSIVKKYEDLADLIKNDVGKNKTGKLQPATVDELKLVFKASEPLHYHFNPSLTDSWDEAVLNYNGSLKNIPLYGAMRTKATDFFKGSSIGNSNSNLNDILKAVSGRPPEVHHILYKKVRPEYAIQTPNLVLTERSSNEKRDGPGQHELYHKIASGNDPNKFGVLLPQFEDSYKDWLKSEGHPKLILYKRQ